jgi:hypothetical protein
MGAFQVRSDCPDSVGSIAHEPRAAFPDYTRSYVGYQMSAVDRDLDPNAPTMFELCKESLAALSVISRGWTRIDDRRHHSPIGLPRRANAFQRQRRRLARHRP